MNLLVITTSKIVNYAVDNADPLTDDGTYLTDQPSELTVHLLSLNHLEYLYPFYTTLHA